MHDIAQSKWVHPAGRTESTTRCDKPRFVLFQEKRTSRHGGPDSSARRDELGARAKASWGRVVFVGVPAIGSAWLRHLPNS